MGHTSSCSPFDSASLERSVEATLNCKGMTMSKVTVYQYMTHRPRSRHMRIAPRWATRSAIESLNRGRLVAVLLNDTEMEIDESYVDRDGMTEVGFGPSS
jgi:hypothetical protein